MNEITVDDAQDDGMPPPPDHDVVADVERPGKRAARLRRKEAEPREVKPLVDLRTHDNRGIAEWLKGLSPSGAVRVQVTRKDPTLWRGLNVGGILHTYEDMIDDKVLAERHGGGTYELEVKGPGPHGGWKYAGQRTIKIAGDPRTDDVYREPMPTPPVVQGAAPGTIELIARTHEREIERMAQQKGGLDLESVRVLMAPLQAQLEQMAAMLRAKDEALAAAQQPKPPERDEFRDRFMSKLMDDDTARVAALRAQFESELRQVKQSALDNEARLRDGFDRDKQALAMSHEREIRSLENAHAMTIAALNQSASVTKTLLESEIGRLESTRAEDKAEIAALRAKKEMTPMDALKVADEIRELAGGGASEKTGWDKVGELASAVVGSSPAIQGAIAKVMGGEAAPQPQVTQPPQPQVRVRRHQVRHFQGPDGNLYRTRPDGTYELEAKRPPPPPGQPAIPPIPVADLKSAVAFLETAYRNGKEAVEVATTVRNMIPGEVLTAIRELGIDGFLTNVAKLDGTSPLASQAGRNWTRRLGKALVGE